MAKKVLLLNDKGEILTPFTPFTQSTTRWFKIPVYGYTLDGIVDRSLEVASIWLSYDIDTNRCLYSNWTELLSNTVDLNSLFVLNSDAQCVEYTGPTTFIPDIEGAGDLQFLIEALDGNNLTSPIPVNDIDFALVDIEIDAFIARVESQNVDFIIHPASSGGGGGGK